MCPQSRTQDTLVSNNYTITSSEKQDPTISESKQRGKRREKDVYKRQVEDSGAEFIDDLPITKSPPFEYTDMNDFQRTLLNAYFTRHGLDEDTTAVELMSYFRTRYDIDNTYSAEDMRKIRCV